MKRLLLFLMSVVVVCSRRSESEILDLSFYKKTIRKDYYQPSLEAETFEAMKNLIAQNSEVPRYNFSLDEVPNYFAPEND